MKKNNKLQIESATALTSMSYRNSPQAITGNLFDNFTLAKQSTDSKLKKSKKVMTSGGKLIVSNALDTKQPHIEKIARKDFTTTKLSFQINKSHKHLTYSHHQT